MEEDDPLNTGDIEIADGMHARAGRLALNARMTDVRATQLLAALPEGNFILRLKFLHENDDDWVLEDKFDPVRTERKKGQGAIEISRDTKPGVLTGIDSVFYQNAYPVTAVAYGLYSIRDHFVIFSGGVEQGLGGPTARSRKVRRNESWEAWRLYLVGAFPPPPPLHNQQIFNPVLIIKGC